MYSKQKNFAFIDAQNLTMGVRILGWELDWLRFSVYLREKYSCKRIFVFIGYIKRNKKFYSFLRSCGYILIFKPVVIGRNYIVKGNCDSDMVLYILTRIRNYEGAVVITSDGDFYSTVRLLIRRGKLKTVISPNINECSSILKAESKQKIVYLNELRKILSRPK